MNRLELKSSDELEFLIWATKSLISMGVTEKLASDCEDAILCYESELLRRKIEGINY